MWGFEFQIGILNYLMNIDEKFLFVKIFYVVYVFELIGKSLGLFKEDLEAMRRNSIEFWNSAEIASSHQFHVPSSVSICKEFWWCLCDKRMNCESMIL